MAAPKQVRTAQTAGRPGSAKARDRGTRGGRPDPQQAVPPARSAAQRTGNGPQRTGQQRTGQQTGPAARKPSSAATAGRAVTDRADSGIRATPLWLQLTTWALAAGGLAVSIYLTIAHYNTKVTLACPATSHVNCEKVTTSPESVVFGIPVAVLGLTFFVFIVAATSPWAWKAKLPALRWARLGSVIIGMAFVLYLIYTELFTLNLTICLWCTSVHVITFLLFTLIMYAFAAGYGVPEPPQRR
jgi:uncharacterized membrane protein